MLKRISPILTATFASFLIAAAWPGGAPPALLVVLALTLVVVASREVVIWRRDSEAEARDSAMRALSAAALDCVIVADVAGRITDFSPVAEQTFRHRRENVLGKDLADVVFPPETRAEQRAAFELLRQANAGPLVGCRVELFAKRADESLFPVEMAVSEIRTSGQRIFVAHIRDITQRRAAEDALRRSERGLAEAQRIARVGSWQWDPDSGAVSWSPQMYRLFGRESLTFQPSYSRFMECVHPDDREDVAHAIGQAHLSASTMRIDHRIMLPDASVRYVSEQAEFVVDDDGASRFLGTTLDITERKLAEEALRRSEQSLARAQRLAHIGDWEWDPQTLRVLWSNELYRICGIDPATAAPTLAEFEQFVHPDDRADFKRLTEAVRNKAAGARLDYRIVRPKGQVRVVHGEVEPILDANGQVSRFAGTILDITDFSQAQDALRRSEAEHRTLFEMSAVGNLELETGTGRILRANRKMTEITGYTVDELVGRSIKDLKLAEDAPDTEEMIARVTCGQVRTFEVEKRYVRKDGEVIWAKLNGNVLQDSQGRPERVVTAISDITARRTWEHTLAESERFAKSVVDALRQQIAIVDEHGTIVAVNRAWKEFSAQNGGDGASFEPGANYLLICDAAGDRDSDALAREAAAGIRSVLGLQREEFRLEYPCHSPDEKRWFTMRVTRFAGDGPVRAVIAHENITARKTAQDQIAAINDCFLGFSADPLENIQRLTRVCGELLRADHVVYNRLEGASFVTPAHWNTPDSFILGGPAPTQICNDVVKDGVRQSVCIPDLQRSRYKDLNPNIESFGLQTYLGHCVFVNRSAVGALMVLYKADVKPDDASRRLLGILASGIGIEEERRYAQAAERERIGLKQAVASMEQVLGVVGHELRTPLAGLRAMSEFLLTDLARNAPEFEMFLKLINEEVIRMSQTVSNLLEAARLNSGQARWNFSVFRMRHVCEEAVGTVRALKDGASITCTWEVDPPEMSMRGDADALRRLIINLVSNARKHTEHGEIRVSVSARTDDNGDWADVRVSDTGSGIPPEVLARLGEPFALNAGVVGSTTVSGSGLGFAICKGIVAAHGGTIEIESTVGVGTTVTARLRADLVQAHSLNELKTAA